MTTGNFVIRSLCAVLFLSCGSVAPTGQDVRGDSAGVLVFAPGQTLTSGEFRLPAANAFGEPGFHATLTSTRNLPSDLSGTAGQVLILALKDIGRNGQTCGSAHPLSGCATVDWSDSVGRPGVPAGGVFDNRLTVQLASGPRTFFLSETGVLADTPDLFNPG